MTRMLQGSWAGHRLLDLALRALFTVAGGYRIVEDTVVANPYARRLGEAAWVWANQDHQVLLGVSVVLLVWTDGQLRLPLVFRVWHKGGSSTYDLALALLSDARHRLQCQPACVLFDSWYPSKKLLKRLRDYLEKAGHKDDLDGPLFRPVRGNREGQDERRQLHPDVIDRIRRKYAKRIGLDRGYSARSMRATFITTALDNGASLEDVRRAARHADPSTTKRYDRRGYNPEKSASFLRISKSS
jgi:hypothetical protein